MSVVHFPPFFTRTKFPQHAFTLLVLLLSTSVNLNPVLGQGDNTHDENSGQSSLLGSTEDSTVPVIVTSTSSISSSFSDQIHEQHHGGDDEENLVPDQDPALAAATMSDEDETCPCASKQDCPRIYGSDPMDYQALGQLPPCKQAGYVRCCGVSVSVLQKTDEVIDVHEVPAATDDNEDEASVSAATATWEVGHEDDSENGENSSSSSPTNFHKDEPESHDKKEVENHESGEESEDVQEEKEILDDNEDLDDNIPEESRQSSPQIAELPESQESSSSLKKRFQARHKFHKNAAKQEETAVPEVAPYSTTSSDEKGNSYSTSGIRRRKTFSPLHRSAKFQPPSTSSSYAATVYPTDYSINSGGDGDSSDSAGGSVVYSKRVSQYTSYRSRNHQNSNKVDGMSTTVATEGENTSVIPSENPEVSYTNSENGRPQRKRRPLIQMRNRPQYQQQHKEGELFPSQESSASDPTVYGSSGPSDPTPLHVPIQEELSTSPESGVMGQQDELDNGNQERRPMSRIVKPTRVNGLHHRRRKQQLAGNKLGGENGESLYSTDNNNNNSYGGIPTSAAAHAPVSELDTDEQHQEQDGKKGNDDDNSQATNGSWGEVEGTNNGVTNAATSEDLANSPTGKLIPVRPKIRPFNRNKGKEKTQGWSSPTLSEDNADAGGESGGDSEIKYHDSKAEEVGPLNGLVQTVEKQPQNNGVVNIRRIPIRRVQPKQEQQIANISLEGSPGGGDDGKTDEVVPVSKSPVNSSLRRRIPMTRPIKQQEPEQAVQAQPEVETGETFVEKLDVRKRLRGRPRPNLLKSTSVTPQDLEISQETSSEIAGTPGNLITADGAPAEVELTPATESSRSPLLRKRVRPAVRPLQRVRGQAHQNDVSSDQTAGAETENPILSSGLASSPEEIPVDMEKHIPLNRIRTRGRLTTTRTYPPPEESQKDESTTITTDSTPEAARPSSLLNRHRQTQLSSRRGNRRYPSSLLASEAVGTDSVGKVAADVASVEDASISTSEAPVTVTSTYSRIRTNSKNSLLTRPIYRRPAFVSTSTTTPTPLSSSSEDEYASAVTKTSSRFGQKTRFPLPSKSSDTSSNSLHTTEGPAVTTVIIGNRPSAPLDDNETEKRGQSENGQLNVQSNNASEDYSGGGNVGRRKVAFIRRKIVRGRPKQQEREEVEKHREEQLQSEQLTEQENKPGRGGGGGSGSDEGESYDETGSNPESQENSEHVSSKFYTGGPVGDITQEQSPLVPGGNGSPTTDNDQISVKIHSLKGIDGEQGDSSNEDEETPKEERYEDDSTDKNKQAGADGDDENPKPSLDEKTSNFGNYNYPDDSSSHQVIGHHVATDAESDTYDLVLNQDVRKMLGTQQQKNTHHHTQNSDAEQLHAYKSPSQQDTHLENQHGGGGGESDNNNGNRQQQQLDNNQDDYYDTYYDSPEDDATHHKYSAGVKTLEMGTPDFESNPGHNGEDMEGQYDYQAYDNLEDEGESRVHVKYLKKKSSSSKSIESSPLSSLNQNESNLNNYNGDTAKTPVNPSVESSASHDSDLRREINRERIRQKLRRPQNAYINSSPSGDHPPGAKNRLRATTTTPVLFSPSIQSPRPTYSGQEALLESVHQSKFTTSTENPNFQQFEPFAEQNTNRVGHQHPTTTTTAAPKVRNRSRVRVKLVTLKTTTPAPVVAPGTENDNYNDDHPDSLTPDASTTIVTANEDKKNSISRNKFIFPPFRKSELTLIPSSPETSIDSEEGEQPSRAKLTRTRAPSPQRVVFRPTTSTSYYSSPATTTTTTTTTTPPPRKPLRNYNYNHNGGDNDEEIVSSYNSFKTKRPTSMEQTVTSPPGIKTRFKVNSLNKLESQLSRLPATQSSYSSPSISSPSIESIKQVSPPSSSPVTKKPQPRIKTPSHNRRLPSALPTTTTTTTTTTESPRVVYPTSSPPNYYYQQYPTQEQEARFPEGDEENVISIRISGDTLDSSSSVIDHQDQDENLVEPPPPSPQYPQQQMNIQPQYYPEKQEISQQLSSTYLPPLPPASPLASSYDASLPPTVKFHGKKQVAEKGIKYASNGRFKVPSKFELQKPHLLPSKNNDEHSIEETSMRKPYMKPALSSTSSGEPPQVPEEPQRQHVQYHIPQQQRQPTNNLYNNGNADVTYDEPPYHLAAPQQQLVNKPALHQTVQARPEPEESEDEEELEGIVPDISINVLPPPDSPPPQQPQHIPNYDSYDHYDNFENGQYNSFQQQAPLNVIHAVREPQRQPPQHLYHPESLQAPPASNQFAPVLKNSPFGPFPSTDHWSGIPSSNSPKLPEYFEQNRVPDNLPPQQQYSFELDNNELRRPLHQAPFPPHFEQRPFVTEQRPQQADSDIRFVGNDGDKEDDNQVLEHASPAQTPVNPMVIQFGTEFEKGAEEGREEEIYKQSLGPPVNFPNSLSSLSSPPFQNQQKLPQLRPPNIRSNHRHVVGGNQEFLVNNNNNLLLPPNEQQLHNVHRQPASPLQEPLIRPGIPSNTGGAPPPPTSPISIEIKGGELVTPDFPQENIKDLRISQQRPPLLRPNPNQQKNNQLPPMSPPPSKQQIQMNHENLPPSHQILRENVVQTEKLRESPQQQLPPSFPQMNSQHTPKRNPNIVVQVDGQPHDAVPPPPAMMNQLLHSQGSLLTQKPMERPMGIEIEPEMTLVTHSPLQSSPNFLTLIPEGHHPNTRDQAQIQQQPQSPPRQQNQPPSPQGGTKFPETIIPGFNVHHPPPRPGQFGPPPLNLHTLPQYVPFNFPSESHQNKEKMNVTGGGPADNYALHQRPPVLPPPSQAFQNPFKFNDGLQQQQQQQPGQQQRFPPQKIPHRQNYNGNIMNSPNPSFNPRHPLPHQQSPSSMPRIPPGQYGPGYPHHYQQQLPPHHPRLRNSGGMRTSRAANFTAEEAKDDEITATGRADVPKPMVETHEKAMEETLQTPNDSSQDAPPQPQQPENAMANADLTTRILENVALASQQQRQQQKLTFNPVENSEDSSKEAANPAKKASDLRKEEPINEESFVQDQLPDESQESADERAVVVIKSAEEDIANLFQIISLAELKRPRDGEEAEQMTEKMQENHGDNPLSTSASTMIKSGKQKKLLLLQEQQQNHKGKLEMSGKGAGAAGDEQRDGRLVGAKRTLSPESKKSILVMKKEKRVEAQTKENMKKELEKMESTDVNDKSTDKSQQEFVAPKVIQRGFHPILPYSEQDPGPIRVQMMNLPIPVAAKVEKFLPPFGFPVITVAGQTMEPTINREESNANSNNNNNGASLPIMPTSGVAEVNGSGSSAPPTSMVMMMSPGKMNNNMDHIMFHNNINKHVLNGNIPVIMVQPNLHNQHQQSLPSNHLA